MRAVLAWVAVAALGWSANAGCAAAGPHGGGSGDPALAQDWLDGDDTIEPAHLERVMSLARRDPNAAALFEEARTRLGRGSIDALAQRFTTCSAHDGFEPGRAQLRCEHALLGLEIEDVAAGAPSPASRQRISGLTAVPARDVRVDVGTDYVLVERTLLPEICVVARLSLAEAYEVLVHELVHALRYEPCRMDEDAKADVDDATFLTQLVLVSGGEADAYASSIPARLRLDRARSLTSPLLEFFDPASGSLRTAREAMVPRILASPPAGLGYAAGRLRDARAEAKRAQVQELTLKRQFLEDLLARREAAAEVHAKNVDVHAHNAGVSRHNMDVGQARRDAAMTSKWRAELAKSEQGLAETKKLLEVAAASRERLGAELATVAASLAQLSATTDTAAR